LVGILNVIANQFFILTMENWGIVTHDNWLARSPIGRIELYNLVMIICHETAHQW
jgi:hypothetical protein